MMMLDVGGTANSVQCLKHGWSLLQVPNSTQEAVYLTCRVDSAAAQLLLELRFARNIQGVACACKSERPDLSPLVFSAMRRLLA